MSAMRFTCAALLCALPAAFATPAAAQTGTVEFTARATPTGGRDEPAARLRFFLLHKSFADIRKEAEEPEPRADLNRFVDELNVSPELKAWMKRTRSVELSGEEFVRRLTANDVLEVPEFFEAFLAQNTGDLGLPAPKSSEASQHKNQQKYEKQQREYSEQLRKYIRANPHTLAGIDIHLAAMNPGQRWARAESSRRERMRQLALALAQTKYLTAKTETDLEGRAALAHIAPGNYWLSTLEGEAVAGDARLRWDLPVTVRAGQVARIELSNLNSVSARALSNR
jgi:hypothetical protein